VLLLSQEEGKGRPFCVVLRPGGGKRTPFLCCSSTRRREGTSLLGYFHGQLEEVLFFVVVLAQDEGVGGALRRRLGLWAAHL